MDTNTTPKPKIEWGLYNGYINYLAGYLSGEEGHNHSYAIKIIREDGRTIYRLSSLKFGKLIDCRYLEFAKAFAERVETNK